MGKPGTKTVEPGTVSTATRGLVDVMLSLVLWDGDHTLIDNDGVSKANYALAFEILSGRTPDVGAKTDGRTDLSIMAGILTDNGEVVIPR